MSKSKWKEIERIVKRGGFIDFMADGNPYVLIRVDTVLKSGVCSSDLFGMRIPMRTYRKMWALAKNNTHPAINRRTVFL